MASPMYRMHGWNLPYADQMRIRAQLGQLDRQVDQIRNEPCPLAAPGIAALMRRLARRGPPNSAGVAARAALWRIWARRDNGRSH
jgi:hypothetical protein